MKERVESFRSQENLNPAKGHERSRVSRYGKGLRCVVPLKSPRGTITQQRGAASHGHRWHGLMTMLPDDRRRRWVGAWGTAVAPPERGLLGGAIPCPKREAAHGR